MVKGETEHKFLREHNKHVSDTKGWFVHADVCVGFESETYIMPSETDRERRILWPEEWGHETLDLIYGDLF